MNIALSIRNGLVPIHRAGRPFIVAGVLATVAASFIWTPLAWSAGLVTLWVCYFFRDPERTTPVEDGIVVSPADGRISMIAEVLPPPELDLPRVPMLRVSVFMSIFDCHVNRMPVEGRIRWIAYTPGKFFNADLDKASQYNERNVIAIETPYGAVAVVQIAGLIARRIVHWAAPGDKVEVGQRFGLIRFGSRLDVYLPADAILLVTVGQTAVVGETMLGKLRGVPPERGYRTG
ncbi:phosphatidylserine decarboxylase [Shinella sp. JR1-6]|uniref:phosphatidylserine decarboxylase n=1 Tax=Shinella sp. JR1-6 TaxID=2527671 RepID=UPI00102D4973|nr:phosphatidylserine decarboxylase [Shinella sp. JR1-6]TAA56748.1 phosphatidylserine decarboxylase [Shinella sp. JR1-6]